MLTIKKILLVTLCVVSSFNASALTLRIGHNASPNDLRTWAAEGPFAEKLAELTNGEIKVKVFPAGQLGDTKQMLEGLKIGTLDAQMEDPGVLATYGKFANLPWIPFLYDSEEHFFKVWKSPLGQDILNKIEQDTGYKQMGLMYRGARNISSNKVINNADDIKGLKIRVPNSPMMIAGFKAIGASPTPMAFTEVFGALQRKVIDAQENPLEMIETNSLYEVSPYITMSQHVFGAFYFQWWGERFNRLSPEHQKAIKEASEYAAIKYNEKQKESEKVFKSNLELKSNVKFKYLDVNTLKEFERKVNEMVEVKYPDLYPYVEKIKAMN